MSLTKLPYLYENIFSIYRKSAGSLSDILPLMTKSQLDELTVHYGKAPYSRKNEAVKFLLECIPGSSQIYFEYVSHLEYEVLLAVMNGVERCELEDLPESEQGIGYFWVKVVMTLVKKGYIFQFVDEKTQTDTLVVADEVRKVIEDNKEKGYDRLCGRFENVIDFEEILVSLYGIVTPSLFMKYWNRQFPALELKDEKEAYQVMRDAAYLCDNLISYTEDFIMHPSMHHGEEERIISMRSGKRQFMYSKDEFGSLWKEYCDDYDEAMEDINGYFEIEYRNPSYGKMKEFLMSKSGEDDGQGILLFIMNYMKKGCPVTRVIEYINERFDFTAKLSSKEAEKFFFLYQNLNNSTRLWVNWGWTPYEMSDTAVTVPDVQEKASAGFTGFGGLENLKVIPKVGRNDPCPCGSGKKYKQCHGR